MAKDASCCASMRRELLARAPYIGYAMHALRAPPLAIQQRRRSLNKGASLQPSLLDARRERPAADNCMLLLRSTVYYCDHIPNSVGGIMQQMRCRSTVHSPTLPCPHATARDEQVCSPLLPEPIPRSDSAKERRRREKFDPTKFDSLDESSIDEHADDNFSAKFDDRRLLIFAHICSQHQIIGK